MPRRRLTTRFVDSVKGRGDARLEYFDVQQPGLVLRVNSGSKVWRVAFRVHGRWTRINIGAYPNARGKLPALDLAGARKLARQKLGEVAAGRDPAADHRADKQAGTFGQLATMYLELHARPHKRSADEDERMLKVYLLPKWQYRKAKDISVDDVQAVIDEIAARPAPIMANRVRALASKVFAWGKTRYKLPINPVRDSQKALDESIENDERILTPDEIRRVWTALDSENVLIRSLFRLRLITAQRGGEVLRMRWKDLDLDGKWWRIPKEHAKNKRPHLVPLSESALTIIRELQGHAETITKQRGAPSEWALPSPVHNRGHLRNVMKALGRVRDASGVEGFRGHHLRHTAATLMAEAGVPESYIPKVLNHVEANITRKVYNRYDYAREKRAALDAWDRKLTAILKDEQGAGNLLTFVARTGVSA